ncbi:hypothetical protein PR202_gb03825 [Eleusine coracana subsp. coracana]|uniref:Fungal lipase-type domain-containing protein n=1 Tax=Eleusine coracana subsp. coracana TaxID=191504 RepID=A0AAV5E2Z8_ELECO|nr:hypothetical protein PR202_gb03825 [Eleusine coracana subsp. coracana]
MERRGLLRAAVLLCLLAACSGRELSIKHQPSATIYNSTLAKILVEYASAIYTADLTQLFSWTCARCGDMVKGFEMMEIIVDVENCLQAYVGFASDINAVIVVFRGTQENSIQNWVEDLLWKQLDLDYPGMPEAMVNYGLDGVKLMTFGQPRIGNAAFASYFKKYLPHAIRVTNAHDIVPHLPPYFSFLPQKTYHHFPREVWVHNVGLGSLVYSVEQICDDSGEDSACSRSVPGNSVKDHINYLGVSMHAEDWSSCRIVMDYSRLKYQMDLKGNLVLSKQPDLSNDRGFSAQ